MSDESSEPKIYTQSELDTFKQLAYLNGQLYQFEIDDHSDADLSKIKNIAQLLEGVLNKYADSLPHDAAVAAEFVDTALKMFIKALP